MTTLDGRERPLRPLRALRRAARELLHWADRALHPARRERARRRLRGAENVTSVVFICHGNICRSPYAEVAFRAHDLMRGRDIAVGSAGFIGPDRPSPPEAVAAARTRGHDLTPHRSRLMDPEILEADLVVVMDARQQRAVAARQGRPERILVLGDVDPEPISRRAITDPWGRDEGHFDRVYERIDRCVDELARLLSPDPVVRDGGGR